MAEQTITPHTSNPNLGSTPKILNNSNQFCGKNWFFRLKGDGGLEQHEAVEGKFVVSGNFTGHVNRDGSPTRYFACFNTVDDFIEWTHVFREYTDEFHVYEYIYGGKEQKMKFDIDMKVDDLAEITGDRSRCEEFGDFVVCLVIDTCIDELSKLDLEVDTERDFIVFSSHGREKYSYHIVLDNFIFTNGGVPAEKEALLFFNRVVSSIKDNEEEYGTLALPFLDASVYSGGQQFRLVGSSKYGSNRVKTPVVLENGEMRFGHIVENADEMFRKSLVGAYDCLNFDPVEIPSIFSELPFDEQLQHLNRTPGMDTPVDLEESRLTFALERLNIHIQENVPTFAECRNNMILLENSSGYVCPICNRVHENDNPFILCSDHTITFDCRRRDPGTGCLILWSKKQERIKNAVTISDLGLDFNRNQNIEIENTSEPMGPIVLDFIPESLSSVGIKSRYPQYSLDDAFYFGDFKKWLGRFVLECSTKDKPEPQPHSLDIFFTQMSRCMAVISSCPVDHAIVKKSPTQPFQHASLPRFNVRCRWPNENNGYTYGCFPGSKILDLKEPLTYRYETMFLCHRDDPTHIDPETCDIFNTFGGFKAKLIPGPFTNAMYKEIEPILSHIYEVWANSNPEYYRYIMSWLAHPIRFLEKTGVLLYLIGDQGTGKSSIHKFFSKYVIGELSTHTYGHLSSFGTSNFNGEIVGKIRIHIEEAKHGGNQSIGQWEKLKSMITDDVICVERKGMDKINSPNLMCISVCSNHRSSLYLPEGDRRYAVFETSNKYKGNTAYFTHLETHFNQRCGDLMYTYLRSEVFEPLIVDIKLPPETSIRKDTIESCIPAPIRFATQILESERALVPLPNKDGNMDYFISSEDLYSDFIEWCQHNASRNTNIKQRTLASRIGNIFGTKATRRRINGIRVYGFVLTALQHPNIICFRSHDDTATPLFQH